MRSHNYIGKHAQKEIDEAVCDLLRTARVVSAFHSCTACNEHELICLRRVGGHPLYLRPSQRKWTCCCSVLQWKVSNELAAKSSNVHSSESEPGGTCILQSHCWMYSAAMNIFQEGVMYAVCRNTGTTVRASVVASGWSQISIHRILKGLTSCIKSEVITTRWSPTTCSI